MQRRVLLSAFLLAISVLIVLSALLLADVLRWPTEDPTPPRHVSCTEPMRELDDVVRCGHDGHWKLACEEVSKESQPLCREWQASSPYPVENGPGAFACYDPIRRSLERCGEGDRCVHGSCVARAAAEPPPWKVVAAEIIVFCVGFALLVVLRRAHRPTQPREIVNEKVTELLQDAPYVPPPAKEPEPKNTKQQPYVSFVEFWDIQTSNVKAVLPSLADDYPFVKETTDGPRTPLLGVEQMWGGETILLNEPVGARAVHDRTTMWCQLPPKKGGEEKGVGIVEVLNAQVDQKHASNSVMDVHVLLLNPPHVSKEIFQSIVAGGKFDRTNISEVEMAFKNRRLEFCEYVGISTNRRILRVFSKHNENACMTLHYVWMDQCAFMIYDYLTNSERGQFLGKCGAPHDPRQTENARTMERRFISEQSPEEEQNLQTARTLTMDSHRQTVDALVNLGKFDFGFAWMFVFFSAFDLQHQNQEVKSDISVTEFTDLLSRILGKDAHAFADMIMKNTRKVHQEYLLHMFHEEFVHAVAFPDTRGLVVRLWKLTKSLLMDVGSNPQINTWFTLVLMFMLPLSLTVIANTIHRTHTLAGLFEPKSNQNVKRQCHIVTNTEHMSLIEKYVMPQFGIFPMFCTPIRERMEIKILDSNMLMLNTKRATVESFDVNIIDVKRANVKKSRIPQTRATRLQNFLQFVKRVFALS